MDPAIMLGSNVSAASELAGVRAGQCDPVWLLGGLGKITRDSSFFKKGLTSEDWEVVRTNKSIIFRARGV